MDTLHAQIEKCKHFFGNSRHLQLSFSFESVFSPDCSAGFLDLSMRFTEAHRLSKKLINQINACKHFQSDRGAEKLNKDA